VSAVVFLRGVNVGGHRTFRPSLLAAALAHLGVVNVGAAGTFVVREPGRRAQLVKAFRDALPFDAEVIVCPGHALLALGDSDPFPARLPPGPVRRFVSVMAKAPARVPPLPLCWPADGPWQITFVAISGAFACGWWRRRGLGKGLVDPNGVTERVLGVRSTARNWNTIEKVRAILAAQPQASSGARAARGPR
jgi:uncharacterized protein (DUF1697 family)